jgi:hypothetical protein
MMQQMGAAGQGMFPMMQPNMWNMPMTQWSQFFWESANSPSWFQPLDDDAAGDRSQPSPIKQPG